MNDFSGKPSEESLRVGRELDELRQRAESYHVPEAILGEVEELTVAFANPELSFEAYTDLRDTVEQRQAESKAFKLAWLEKMFSGKPFPQEFAALRGQLRSDLAAEEDRKGKLNS